MDSSSSESDMNDSSQTSSSESDGKSNNVGEGGGTRKCRRHMKRSNYLQGKCRKVHTLNESLDQYFVSDISIRGACPSLALPKFQMASNS